MSTDRQKDADALDHSLFTTLQRAEAFRLKYPRALGDKGYALISELEREISRVRHYHVRPLMDPEQRAATSGSSQDDDLQNDKG